jgi:hypothetical protein
MSHRVTYFVTKFKDVARAIPRIYRSKVKQKRYAAGICTTTERKFEYIPNFTSL